MNLLSRLFSFFREKNNLLILSSFIAILFVMLTNAVHESYPDEFDNILGGWLLLQGKPLYSAFFTHHNPIAYMIAAVIELFSGQSFVRFRIIYTLFLFAYFAFTFFYFRRKFGQVVGWVYLAFIGVLSVASIYFWGHMLLADNLAGYFFGAVFALLFFKTILHKPLQRSDLVFISVLSFLAVFSSLTYIYLVMGLYLYTFYFWTRSHSFHLKKSLIPFAVIFAIPYGVLLLYLVITGSLFDYYYQAFVFNGKYYIYNYPGHQEGVGFVNPVRYAIIIAYNFFHNFTVLLQQVIHFNFGFPYNITLALGNVVMIIFLLLKRKFAFALFLLFFLTYSNVRSNPLDSKETDYQSAVYMVVSLFNIVFGLYYVYREAAGKVWDMRRLIFAGLFIFLAVYSFFTATYLLRTYSQKAFHKFMGFQALIYDRPLIAPILNAVTTEDDFVWIGPFAFEEHFYTHASFPSKYHILLPGFKTAEKVQTEMLADFNRNKPVLMYFDPQFFILGRSPEMYGQFFIDFADEYYVTLQDLSEQGQRYESAIEVTDKVNVEQKLYILKDRQNEMLQKLIDAGIIRRETS